MHTGLAARVLLIAAFMFLFCIIAKGQSIATEKVTLGLKDESMETAIKRIEQQSALRFFYRDEDILPLGHLNLAPGTRTIEQTLDILLQNTFLSYRQIDGHILLERAEKQAYYEISGRVVDTTDKKPVANASVFLNNSTIGTITGNNGSFKLDIAKPGKYELVVSIIGYAAYQKPLFIDKDSIMPGDVEISPQVIALAEVKIKRDPHRDRDYNWFKEDFLGNQGLANKCSILNPELLDLDYDEKTQTLSASTAGFLEIENQALGYKIKYILTRFSANKNTGKVSYKGSALFETLTGGQAQQQKWQRNRLKAYKGSAMHFLRSALYNQLDEEGFKVLR